MNRLEQIGAIYLGNPEKAIRLLRKEREAGKEDQETLHLLVVALLQAGRSREAKREAELFLRRYSQSVLAMRALAEVYRVEQREQTALLILNRAMLEEPENVVVGGELALLLGHPRDRFRQATLLKEASSSRHPETLANFARLAFLVGEKEQACSEWDVAFTAGGRYHPTIEKYQRLCSRLKGEEKP